jgi:hypothetical protein
MRIDAGRQAIGENNKRREIWRVGKLIFFSV